MLEVPSTELALPSLNYTQPKNKQALMNFKPPEHVSNLSDKVFYVAKMAQFHTYTLWRDGISSGGERSISSSNIFRRHCSGIVPHGFKTWDHLGPTALQPCCTAWFNWTRTTCDQTSLFSSRRTTSIFTLT